MMPFWLKILVTPTCFLFFQFLSHWLCRIGTLGRNRLGGFSGGLTVAWLPGSLAGSSGWWTFPPELHTAWLHAGKQRRTELWELSPAAGVVSGHTSCCARSAPAGLPYPEEVDQSGDIVVSGYHDADGAFISLTPPVRVPQAEIPYTTAGEIDIEALVEKARRRSAEFTPRGSAWSDDWGDPWLGRWDMCGFLTHVVQHSGVCGWVVPPPGVRWLWWGHREEAQPQTQSSSKRGTVPDGGCYQAGGARAAA